MAIWRSNDSAEWRLQIEAKFILYKAGIRNMVQNALEYTGDKSRVRWKTDAYIVACQEKHESIYIAVHVGDLLLRARSYEMSNNIILHLKKEISLTNLLKSDTYSV